MGIENYQLWAGFLLGVGTVLWLGKKDLAKGMLTGSLVLGFLTLPVGIIGQEIVNTLTDPSIVLLALAVGIIPIIGGLLEASGFTGHLVQNLRIGKRAFVVFAPALLGMLPMPGGALFSAPLLKRVEKGIENDVRVASNVWYRHILLLIYPLSPALMATSKMAGLELYTIIPIMTIPFAFALLIGYVFFLLKIKGKMEYQQKFSARELSLPLVVILSAPIVDFLVRRLFELTYLQSATVFAVLVSLSIGIELTGIKGKKLMKVAKDSQPWKFAIIIFAMFIFLNIFEASGIPRLIAGMNLSFANLAVLVGFVLGFTTGRIQLPFAIVVPIVVSSFGMDFVTPVVFAYMYFSMFLGYEISPVHPCVSVSLEYFKLDLKKYLRFMAFPILISIIIVYIAARAGLGI
ncbi:DUF401 family protein [Candidatus Undinarchaeota archaeon]